MLCCRWADIAIIRVRGPGFGHLHVRIVTMGKSILPKEDTRVNVLDRRGVRRCSKRCTRAGTNGVPRRIPLPNAAAFRLAAEVDAGIKAVLDDWVGRDPEHDENGARSAVLTRRCTSEPDMLRSIYKLPDAAIPQGHVRRDSSLRAGGQLFSEGWRAARQSSHPPTRHRTKGPHDGIPVSPYQPHRGRAVRSRGVQERLDFVHDLRTAEEFLKFHWMHTAVSPVPLEIKFHVLEDDPIKALAGVRGAFGVPGIQHAPDEGCRFKAYGHRHENTTQHFAELAFGHGTVKYVVVWIEKDPEVTE